MLNQCLDAWLDAIEHRLWIHTREYNRRDKHRKQQAFTQRDFGKRPVVITWLAMKYALVSPEQIERCKNDTNCGNDRPPAGGWELTDEDKELTNKTVEPGQTN